MRVCTKLFLIFLSCLFGACATVLHGSTEKIEILSNVNDTQVYINNVYRGIAGPEQPLEVTIPKRGRIAFLGKRNDCVEGEQIVRRSVDPATFLGLLIDGGLISILFVDIMGTNAFVHAEQSSYVLRLDCRS